MFVNTIAGRRLISGAVNSLKYSYNAKKIWRVTAIALLMVKTQNGYRHRMLKRIQLNKWVYFLGLEICGSF
jgi:hypothetical protein